MLDLVVRSVLAPGVLAARWVAPAALAETHELPAPRFSLGLAGKVLLDEFFFLTELLSLRLVSVADAARLAHEVTTAVELFTREGWIDDPRGYHPAPPALEPLDMRHAQSRGVAYQHLTFESGWEPHADEPGRDRWLGYARNRTGHAWILEHPGPPRPWLICIHGYRMGVPVVDFTGFPAAWLHHQLGMNVAFPVLPLHGPRTRGRRTGDGFLTGDYLDTVHLQAQAVWDVRRLLRWLREEREAPRVAAYGISLGGYTAALLAGLSDELDGVVAGIPAISHTGITRFNVPPIFLGLAEKLGLRWDWIEQLVRVVSPLALAPRVPWDRRFVFGATADRLVPAEGVRDLWRHWGRPRLEWYDGSHVSFGWERPVRKLLREAFTRCGLVG
jgi:dienelactone hydrolase